MTERLFADPPFHALPVLGETALYPVHRIFCIGRNYADHAREMGAEPDREAPFYFFKDALSLRQSGASVPYPPRTQSFHYEMELAVAVGRPLWQAGIDDLADAIFGYGCALDMTRRDVQFALRDKGRPWDLAKNIEEGAVLGPITRAEAVGPLGARAITLDHNGARVQSGRLSDMIWSVEDILIDLSSQYHLRPGDVILTGTPAGVGPVQKGSMLLGQIEGLAPVELTIA